MNIKEFLLDNYIWIIVVILLIIITIIGFLADKKKSPPKDKNFDNNQQNNMNPINYQNDNQLQSMMSGQPIQQQPQPINYQGFEQNNMANQPIQNMNFQPINNMINNQSNPMQYNINNNSVPVENINQNNSMPINDMNQNVLNPTENIYQPTIEQSQNLFSQPNINQPQPNMSQIPAQNTNVIPNQQITPMNNQPNQYVNVNNNNLAAPNLMAQGIENEPHPNYGNSNVMQESPQTNLNTIPNNQPINFVYGQQPNNNNQNMQ